MRSLTRCKPRALFGSMGHDCSYLVGEVVARDRVPIRRAALNGSIESRLAFGVAFDTANNQMVAYGNQSVLIEAVRSY